MSTPQRDTRREALLAAADRERRYQANAPITFCVLMRQGKPKSTSHLGLVRIFRQANRMVARHFERAAKTWVEDRIDRMFVDASGPQRFLFLDLLAKRTTIATLLPDPAQCFVSIQKSAHYPVGFVLHPSGTHISDVRDLHPAAVSLGGYIDRRIIGFRPGTNVASLPSRCRKVGLRAGEVLAVSRVSTSVSFAFAADRGALLQRLRENAEKCRVHFAVRWFALPPASLPLEAEQGWLPPRPEIEALLSRVSAGPESLPGVEHGGVLWPPMSGQLRIARALLLLRSPGAQLPEAARCALELWLQHAADALQLPRQPVEPPPDPSPPPSPPPSPRESAESEAGSASPRAAGPTFPDPDSWVQGAWRMADGLPPIRHLDAGQWIMIAAEGHPLAGHSPLYEPGVVHGIEWPPIPEDMLDRPVAVALWLVTAGANLLEPPEEVSEALREWLHEVHARRAGPFATA